MKAFVTLRFEIGIPEPNTPEQFAQWALEDAAGFLLARPTLEERLPYEVAVTTEECQIAKRAGGGNAKHVEG